MSRIFLLLAITAICSPLATSQPGIRKPAMCTLTKGLTKATCGKKGDPIAVSNFCKELVAPSNVTNDPTNSRLSRVGCGLVNQAQLQAAITDALSGISRGNASLGESDTNATITELAANLSSVASALDQLTLGLASLTAVEAADVAALRAAMQQLLADFLLLNVTDVTKILVTINQLNSTLVMLNSTIYGELPPGSEVANAIGALNRTIAQLSVALSDLAGKEAADLAALRAEIAQINATVSIIIGGGAGANVSISALLSQVQALSGKLAALQDTEAADVAALNSAVSQLNSSIQALQAEDQQQNSRLLNLGAATNTLNSTLGSVQGTVASLQAAVDAIDALLGLSLQSSTLVVLNNTLQTLTTRIDSVTNNQTTVVSDVLGLGTTVSSLQGIVDNITGLVSPALGVFDAPSLSTFNLAGVSPGDLGVLIGDSFSSASMSVQRTPTTANPDLALMTLRMTAAQALPFLLSTAATQPVNLPGSFQNRNNANTPLSSFTVVSTPANNFECPFAGDIVGRVVDNSGTPAIRFARKNLVGGLLSVLAGAEFVCQFYATYTGAL